MLNLASYWGTPSYLHIDTSALAGVEVKKEVLRTTKDATVAWKSFIEVSYGP